MQNFKSIAKVCNTIETIPIRKEFGERRVSQSTLCCKARDKLAEIGECRIASASGEGRYIVIVKVVISAGHCRGGVVGSKNRTAVGAM